MMKKTVLFTLLSACACSMSSCGTSQNAYLGAANALLGQGNTTTTTPTESEQEPPQGGSFLENLLGNVLNGSKKLTEKSIVGTWNYTGAECVFQSENLLAQVGGELASSKLESEVNEKLALIGIKPGACSYTFNEDKTYTANLGGRTIQGTYKFDVEKKTLQMTYLAGLATSTTRVAMKNGKLSLLYESTKLMKLVKGIAALSNRQSLKAADKLLDQYQGMYIGMQLEKDK